jgi:hypothetical protein
VYGHPSIHPADFFPTKGDAVWLAAAAAETPEDSYALLNIVFIFAGVVVTVAGGVITTLINKSAKSSISPPPEPAPIPDPGAEVRAIIRQLQEFAHDSADARDIMDRRIERHEIYLELIANHLGIELPRPPSSSAPWRARHE